MMHRVQNKIKGNSVYGISSFLYFLGWDKFNFDVDK